MTSLIVTEERLELVRARLSAHAHLFDDAAAYLAGVDDALDAVRDLGSGRDEQELVDSLPRMI